MMVIVRLVSADWKYLLISEDDSGFNYKFKWICVVFITTASAHICKMVKDVVYLVCRQEAANWGGHGLAQAYTHILFALQCWCVGFAIVVVVLIWIRFQYLKAAGFLGGELLTTSCCLLQTGKRKPSKVMGLALNHTALGPDHWALGFLPRILSITS